MSHPEDERRGRPSCSGLERLEACPGSFLACRGLTEDPDAPKPEAESGNRVHKWLETHADADWLAMTDDEQDTAERCDTQAGRLRDEFLTHGAYEFECFQEKRLGLTLLGIAREVKPGDGIAYLVTGKADRIYVARDSAIIIDFKSGRGDQEHAVTNKQLRGLAVLVAKYYKVTRIRVAIVQPWCGPPTVADFDFGTLNASGQWLKAIINNADNATTDQLNAGDWCQYCLAAENGCPAIRAKALAQPEALGLETLPADPETQKAALFARAMELPAETLAELLRGRKILHLYDSAIEGAAKRRMRDGEKIPGYEIHTTKPREKISAVNVIWERLAAIGCQPGEFTAICSMTKKDLKPMVKKLTGTKGKALDERITEVLDGAVTLGQPSQSIKAVGEYVEDEE